MPLFNPPISSNANFSATMAEVDIGNSPTYTKVVFVVDVKCKATSQILVWQDASATFRPVDENEMDSLTFSTAPSDGYFTLNISAFPGPIVGTYSVNYILL